MARVLIQCNHPLLEQLPSFGQLVWCRGQSGNRGSLGGLGHGNLEAHIIKACFNASDCTINFLRRLRESRVRIERLCIAGCSFRELRYPLAMKLP
jgi:hypothetical protein